MVGRQVELAALVEHLNEALGGAPRIVVCAGEPGIGKTRLAEELMSVARQRGAVCSWGVGVDEDGAPPFWPWRQALPKMQLESVLDVPVPGFARLALQR